MYVEALAAVHFCQAGFCFLLGARQRSQAHPVVGGVISTPEYVGNLCTFQMPCSIASGRPEDVLKSPSEGRFSDRSAGQVAG